MNYYSPYPSSEFRTLFHLLHNHSIKNNEDQLFSSSSLVKKNQLLLEQIFERYPLTTLSHIEHFHYRIQKLMGQKDSKANHHVNFYQPQLITELKSLKTQPIFPRHDDVYIDFNLGVNELALEMTSFQVKQEQCSLERKQSNSEH